MAYNTQRMSHAVLHNMDSPRVHKISSVKIQQKLNEDDEQVTEEKNPFIIRNLDTGEIHTLFNFS